MRSLLLFLLLAAAPLGGQALDGAVFIENVHSEITTQTGSAARRRVVDRMAQFDMQQHGDTLIVTADTVHLTEAADASVRTINVDAVIGARWMMHRTPGNVLEVDDVPVVPQAIADVSDISIAMHDFFLPSPPTLAIAARTVDGAGRKWQRLADSSGLARYHFSQSRDSSSRNTEGGVDVATDEQISESTTIAWHASRGALAWTREIHTSATTRFSGRTVRAAVEQRITVRRVR